MPCKISHSPSDTKIFIRNLADDITEQDVISICRTCGDVRNIWMSSALPNSAFVEFALTDDASYIVEALNEMSLCGRKLCVELYGKLLVYGGCKEIENGSQDGRSRKRTFSPEVSLPKPAKRRRSPTPGPARRTPPLQYSNRRYVESPEKPPRKSPSPVYRPRSPSVEVPRRRSPVRVSYRPRSPARREPSPYHSKREPSPYHSKREPSPRMRAVYEPYVEKRYSPPPTQRSRESFGRHRTPKSPPRYTSRPYSPPPSENRDPRLRPHSPPPVRYADQYSSPLDDVYRQEGRRDSYSSRFGGSGGSRGSRGRGEGYRGRGNGSSRSRGRRDFSSRDGSRPRQSSGFDDGPSKTSYGGGAQSSSAQDDWDSKDWGKPAKNQVNSESTWDSGEKNNFAKSNKSTSADDNWDDNLNTSNAAAQGDSKKRGTTPVDGDWDDGEPAPVVQNSPKLDDRNGTSHDYQRSKSPDKNRPKSNDGDWGCEPKPSTSYKKRSPTPDDIDWGLQPQTVPKLDDRNGTSHDYQRSKSHDKNRPKSNDGDWGCEPKPSTSYKKRSPTPDDIDWGLQPQTVPEQTKKGDNGKSTKNLQNVSSEEEWESLGGAGKRGGVTKPVYDNRGTTPDEGDWD